MADELPFKPDNRPTETLFDQVVLKYVDTMKAEFMSICAREVASLENECESLRQQLSVFRMQGASDWSRHDSSDVGRQGRVETTGIDDKSKCARQISDTEESSISLMPMPSSRSHVLVPVLGITGKDSSRVHHLMPQKSTGWRTHLQTFVLHPAFEGLALLFVLVNVILLGVETNQLAISQQGDLFVVDTFIISLCCCIFFIIEVVLRIVANWRYFFRGPGRVLNILDFVLVTLQVFEIWVSLLFMDTNLDEKRSVNFAMWRVLRLARIVRLFRSARLLVVFAEVRSTALAVLVSMKPLMGAMVVMFLLCFSFSVILIELAHEEKLELETSAVNDEDERLQRLKFHFGSLGSAVLTLFHCSVTSSASYGFSDVASLFTHWWVRDLLMPFIMILTMLGMLNIITGIFVESTIRQIEQDQRDILVAFACDAFQKVGGHELNQERFMRVVESGHCDKLLEMMKLERRDVCNLWSLICFEADSNDQTFKVDALVSALVKMSGEPRRIDLLLITGMLQELAETADIILNRCMPAEGQVGLARAPSRPSNIAEQRTTAEDQSSLPKPNQQSL